jgi:hypothetical protein
MFAGFFRDRRSDRGSSRYNQGVRRETFINGVSYIYSMTCDKRM